MYTKNHPYTPTHTFTHGIPRRSDDRNSWWREKNKAKAKKQVPRHNNVPVLACYSSHWYEDISDATRIWTTLRVFTPHPYSTYVTQPGQLLLCRWQCLGLEWQKNLTFSVASFQAVDRSSRTPCQVSSRLISLSNTVQKMLHKSGRSGGDAYVGG